MSDSEGYEPSDDDANSVGASEPGSEDESGSEAAEEDEAAADAAAAAQQARARQHPMLQRANDVATIHVVAPDERVTSNMLQPYEAARVLAARAAQIAREGTHFVERSEQDDAVAIAREELYARRCPLILRRNIGLAPDGGLVVEDWPINEMTLPPLAELRR